MQLSERSRPHLKPKHARLKRALVKRRREVPPRFQWFATADDDGNVHIHPNR